MRTIHTTVEKHITSFGQIKAGGMFINSDSVEVMLKLNNEFEGLRNAMFIVDGSTWNFDDSDEVILIKEIVLEA